jgi:hypothetical protein
MEQFLQEKAIYLAVLLGISEALALIPSLNANSNVQLAISFIKKVYAFIKPKQ